MKRSLNFYFVVLKLSHNIYCFICLSWCAYIRSFVVPTKTTKTGILRININSQYQVILKISVPVLFKPGMPMLNKKYCIIYARKYRSVRSGNIPSSKLIHYYIWNIPRTSIIDLYFQIHLTTLNNYWWQNYTWTIIDSIAPFISRVLVYNVYNLSVFCLTKCGPLT
jgi:hypothetical protein